MAFSEVFTSLQNGTIEGQENPLALIKSASFFEVQKYVNRTDHVISWIYLVGGSKKLAKLPAEHQKAIREAAKAAHDYERGLFLADETKLEAELKAKGMTFVEADKAAFAAKAQAAVDAALSAEIKPLYQEILATK
jgi:TRAP-type C4-dicarboxylate transport system substrate-binding protein